MWDSEKVYRDYVGPVFRYVLSLTRNRLLAEDVTGDVFLALLRHRESLEDSRLPAWLFTVAKNRVLDYWRRKAMEQKYSDKSWNENQEEYSVPALNSSLLQHKALKPIHRVCLTLRYVHGMTRSEIGQTTGLSDTQVKGHLQYALKILRKELAKQSDGQQAEPALE